ncbi:GmrSD restriction endonuclease domain-containing protein [Pseudarthrobacter sp. S6]|uniref:GmrSD restriction endonuclease domain-containing protein n=1 Tax=Pseudarthrobacter sp. S6 TaxID=3418420 RepID=UPI003CE739AC
MDTHLKNLQQVFQAGQRFLVPLFQRQYVWNEDHQWAPLWEDIERLTEAYETEGEKVEPHFLGAIVLQNVAGGSMIQTRTIIDGQQRLTTLQLLLHAAWTVLSAHEAKEALYLRSHFRNNEDYLVDADRYKLTPTTRDQDAYQSLMTASYPPGHLKGKSPSLLVRAHDFFSKCIEEWVASGDTARRAHILVSVLLHKITVVAIELEHDEDSQLIFETLNARGTPLTGADLVKNYVFQRLNLNKADTEAMYTKYWSMFETRFWEAEIKLGGYSAPRISNFLAQWLTAQTGRDTPTREVFRKFKQYAEHSSSPSMEAILPSLDASASTYQNWTVEAEKRDGDLSLLGLFAYRASVLGTQSAGPLLIWATDPSKESVPTLQLHKFVSSLESWLMRRALMRAGNGGIGSFIADLISQLNDSSRQFAGDILTALLVEADAANLAWPTDAELRNELRGLAVYSRFRKPLVRLLLESIEDHYRGYRHSKSSYSEGRVTRGKHSIEHLLPQSWAEHWSVGTDVAMQARRADHVHLLGNLTLVAGGLNSKISNGPWLGSPGKLQSLNAHSILLMNQRIFDEGSDGWAEESIRTRGELLISAIQNIWPVAADAKGTKTFSATNSLDQEITLLDLIDVGLLVEGQVLHARTADRVGTATVMPDGSLIMNSLHFDSPSAASKGLSQKATNGWKFWFVDRDRGVTLDRLRRKLGDDRQSPAESSNS